MTTMKLIVYIDPYLLIRDPTTGKVQLGNMTVARKVGGVANVIFRGWPNNYFSVINVFEWNQAYQIGASLTPPQPSAVVR